MTTEKEIMRDIYRIREQLYEETKHMTPEERAEFINRDTEERLAKLGHKFKIASPREEPHAPVR